MRTAGRLLWLCWLLAACAPRIQVPEFAPTPAVTPAASASSPVSGNALAKDPAQQPVAISSSTLTYTDQGKVSVFQGRVKVRQGAALLEAPTLEVRSDDGQALARGGVRLTDPERGLTLTAQELRYRETLAEAKLQGRVRVFTQDAQGDAIRLRADELDWDQNKKTARARGDVMVTYRGLTATSQVLDFDQGGARVDLTMADMTEAGRPRIEQDGDTLTGRAITLFLNERRYRVSGTAQAVLTPRDWKRNPE